MKMPSFSHWVFTNSNCRFEVRPGEHEDDPAVGAVVLEDALGQHRPVARPAADHAMEPDVDAALVVEGVARVRPPRVGAGRALEAAGVVAVEEVVVAGGIGSELGIVALRGDRERRAALPASDHLGARAAPRPPAGAVRARYCR